MTFRDKFYRALRSRKAKGKTWTKAFTYQQVMEVFDQAWEDSDYYKACEAHGACLYCELEELQDRMSEMEQRLADVQAQFEEVAKDAARRPV